MPNIFLFLGLKVLITEKILTTLVVRQVISFLSAVFAVHMYGAEGYERQMHEYVKGKMSRIRKMLQTLSIRLSPFLVSIRVFRNKM